MRLGFTRRFGIWMALAMLALVPAGAPSRASEGESKPPAEKPEAGKGKETGGKEGAEKQEKGAEGEKAGEGAKPAGAQFKLDPPLNGFYDIKVLRSGARVKPFRVEVKNVTEFLGADSDWQALVNLTLEFGGGSGVAEVNANAEQVQADAQRVIQSFEGPELMTPEGKYRLKEMLIDTLNRRLRTAQVRQVYFTDFKLIHIRRQ